MGMEATIGYGGAPQRVSFVSMRPVFVVPGSETVAAVGDEGWTELERSFFVGGAVLDHNLALLQAPSATPARRWPGLARVLASTAALVCLAALLFAAAF